VSKRLIPNAYFYCAQGPPFQIVASGAAGAVVRLDAAAYDFNRSVQITPVNTFTVYDSGLYLICARATFNDLVGGYNTYLQIRESFGGFTALTYDLKRAVAGLQTGLSVTTIRYLPANYELEMWVSQLSGGNVSLMNETSLMMVKLR